MSSEMIFYMYVRLFQIVKKHSKLKKGGKCKFKYTEKKIGQDVVRSVVSSSFLIWIESGISTKLMLHVKAFIY